MDDKTIKDALGKLKGSSKRNFKQTIDLIYTLKDIDLKKTNVDIFVTLHQTKGKKTKVCALVAPELAEQANNVCDSVVTVNEFEKYSQNKRLIKKLARDNDFFIAQATIMPQVATVFGRVLGPRGKMPNPKAGCIVPPNANLQPLYQKLQKTLRLTVKNQQPILQTVVGMEDTPEDAVIDNIKTVHTTILHSLPNERHNIKSVYIKYTMGKPIRIM